MIAPKSAAEYRADARSFDRKREDFRAMGDHLAADRMERRALLARNAARAAELAEIGAAGGAL